MLILTERDREIFRILASGPATIQTIVQELEETNKRKDMSKDPSALSDAVPIKPLQRIKKSEQGAHEKKSGKEKNSPVELERARAMNCVAVRISKLIQNQYIESQLYPYEKKNCRYALYALSDFGKDELINAGYKSQHIRTSLPGPQTVIHELQVTSVIRKLMKEAGEANYNYEMMDENFLKGLSFGNMNGKVYPDIFLTITFEHKSRIITLKFCIEVDNSTINANRVYFKIRKLYEQKPSNCILLCRTQDRLNTLRGAFDRAIDWDKKKAKKGPDIELADNLNKKVFFALTSELAEKGLVGTSFLTVDGREITLV